MALPGPGQLGGPGLPGTGRIKVGEVQLKSNSIMFQDETGRFIKHMNDSADRFLNVVGDRLEKKAKQYAPKGKTLKLRDGIMYVRPSEREVLLISDVPYAKIMERGSRPHKIHGVKANFMWKRGDFTWVNYQYGPIGGKQRGGKYRQERGRKYQNWTWQYGATVNHPGTKGRWFFKRAFEETRAIARRDLRKAFAK